VVASGSDLRLLYVIDSLAPGGAERSLAALAAHYPRLGIALEVVVLTERSGLRDEIEAAGGTVVALEGTSRAARFREVSALIRQREPTLVHTTLFESDIVGRPAARRHGVPVVSTIATEAYGPEHRDEATVRATRLAGAQLVDAVTARCAVRMHAVSEGVKSVMASRLHYPEHRIDVVHRGRDQFALGRRTAERRRRTRVDLSVAEHEVVVLAVARQEPQKALDVLVSAFGDVVRFIPDARLLIAGKEGNATPVIREAVRRLGLADRVTLLGNRSDVGDLLAAADLFVLSSLREGLPGAVIEAMALETPIVATAIPPVIEVTGRSGATLVTPNDAGALAAGIVETLADPTAAAARVAQCRDRFLARFTIERAAQGMLEFYERSLGRATLGA
jgi:glycosyltransferase involved in cell wall biosynthesis